VKLRSADGSLWLFVDSEGDRQLPGKQLAEKIGMDDSWISNMRHAVLTATQKTQKGDAIVIFGSFSAVEQSPWLA
jgi:folylpolyglutamate synthase/dihydropteroate synthase